MDDSKAIHHHMHNTDSERARVSKEVIHNHNDKGGNKNMCHKGQNYKTKNNRNGNKQREQKKKTDRQKNQHQQKDRGRPAYRGGSHQNRPMRQGGGDRKYIKNKQVSKTLGCAGQDRYRPSSACYLLQFEWKDTCCCGSRAVQMRHVACWIQAALVTRVTVPSSNLPPLSLSLSTFPICLSTVYCQNKGKKLGQIIIRHWAKVHLTLN